MHRPGIATIAIGLLSVVILGSAACGGEGYPDQPLINATFFNDLKQVRKLLDEDFDINSRTDRGETALMMALSPSHFEVAKLLLERGIKVNATTTAGATALMMAAARGHMKTVELLLDRGADVHAKSKHGTTALKITQENGHKKIADILKAHRAME
jgi:uncharacterized protein